MRWILILILLLQGAMAQRVRDDIEELKKINVSEKLGDYLPLEVDVIDEQGKKILLGSLFKSETPIVFTFAYYDCPMLCTQVLSSLSSSINTLDWESKNRYQVLTLSIDPRETYLDAAKKKKPFISTLNDSTLSYNWTFLTASQKVIDTLTQSLGFEYYYMQERDEYAHPAVVFVLSPEGKISRYLYGLYYEPKDLKLALLEASDGKIGNTLERLILYCFHYDANANTYVLFARNLMSLGGLLTMFLLGSFLGIFWIRENKKRKLAISKT